MKSITAARVLPALVVVLLSGLAIARVARAVDESAPASQGPASCKQMMAKAAATAAKMPEGVEKTSAQKEIASGRMELQKGSESGCLLHLKNAMEAIQAHGTN